MIERTPILDYAHAASVALDEAELRAQVTAQSRVVAALARNLAEVYDAHAEILELGPSSLTQWWGARSAELMEQLGDILNGMDAVADEDAWMDPVFAQAQRLWPSSASPNAGESSRDEPSSPPEDERSNLSGGWEPIETAPKDGTRFLATMDGFEIEIHSWHAITGWVNDADLYRDPTRWMPLPQDHAPVRGSEGSVDRQTATSGHCVDPQAVQHERGVSSEKEEI